jgi:hypothetical protein
VHVVSVSSQRDAGPVAGTRIFDPGLPRSTSVRCARATTSRLARKRCTVEAADAELFRGRPRPRAAALDQVHDRRQHSSVVGASSTVLPSWWDRDQRLHDVPVVVRAQVQIMSLNNDATNMITDQVDAY